MDFFAVWILLRPPLVVRNEAGVQLLAPSLHKQVFGEQAFPPLDGRAIAISKAHLKRNGLAQKESPVLPTTEFTLPKLQGSSIEEHFYQLGLAHSAPYLDLAKALACAQLPPQPDSWSQTAGWTRYHEDGSFEPVECPPDDALVFDVESLYKLSPFAVMATAVSRSHWYSWTSPWLLDESDEAVQLIPFAGKKPTLLVGHNVGYDRARIQEEYHLRRTQNRFLDTMSLHVAVRGLSSHQRAPWMRWRKQKREAAENGLDPSSGSGMWQDLSSMNSLADVAKLHCDIEMDKSARDWFSSEDKKDVLDQFQELMTYCAGDVSVTHRVLAAVLPAFLRACPNPVTFAGVLHMGSSFLPVDESWEKFLHDAESLYHRLTDGVEEELHKLADQARRLIFERDADGDLVHEKDPWLRQLDWTPKKARPVISPPRPLPTGLPSDTITVVSSEPVPDTLPSELSASVPTASALASSVTIASAALRSSPSSPHGRPQWWKLFYSEHLKEITSSGWEKIGPLLLEVACNGYPLRYEVKTGWYYAVPASEADSSNFQHRITPSPLGAGFACFRPSKAPRRTIFNAAALKLFEKGVLTSPHKAAKLACEAGATSQDRAKDSKSYLEAQEAVLALASKALELPREEGEADPWLSQLDWTVKGGDQDQPSTSARQQATQEPSTPPLATELQESPSQQDSSESSPHVSAPNVEHIWPQWYWDMHRPRPGQDGLNLSIRSRAAPLLLRLRWQGYELFHSRQHGWLYRVPLDEAGQKDGESATRAHPVAFQHTADVALEQDGDHAYYKLPHKEGGDQNVGSPLAKTFIPAFEDGRLSSEYPAARAALEMNAQCSYWISARERVLNQMVVWHDHRHERGVPSNSKTDKHGMILPQVVTMGTVTRRAVESTWLAASNAKKNRLGSELKAMVRAPPGYAIVGADVDSEELWICCVMGDAQFGVHGATAIGWMTLEGTKSAGTDLHSKTAKILGISRDQAKVFNYSRIYGAGVKHATQLLQQANPSLTEDKAKELAKELYASTKGLKQHSANNEFKRKFWYGGTESHVFNTLEKVAMADNPSTPALGCGITAALAKDNLPATEKAKAGEDFMPSRINWVVQSSGVDYLHLLIVSMEYLVKTVSGREFFGDAFANVRHSSSTSMLAS